MKKFKRISSFLVACSMVFGMMTSFVQAAVPADVVGTKYEESIELLKALEVMVGDAESGAMRTGDGILRSEFASVAVRLAGMDDIAKASQKDRVPGRS